MAYKKRILGLLTFVFAVILSSYTSISAHQEFSGKTSYEITSEMGLGWNLGNTFDATGGNKSNLYSQETSWGNPKVTSELIKAIHDRGFKTIRIPVTWGAHHISKDGSYTINPEFLARVREVVTYAYDLDMFIILNLHHEPWVNVSSLDTTYDQVGEELEAVWAQIADYFADFDQHLIFEGMNEPRMAGTNIEWTGNQKAYNAINYLNQIFTFTVRNNGKGFNSERCLMIPGYAASSSSGILQSICIPTFEGEAVKNIIISVHSYNPYNFCLSDEMFDFDPENKDHTASIDRLFKNLEEMFLFNDIPVVIGETGATEKNNTEQRENWAEYMGCKAVEYGIPICIWDNGHNGHSGGECHAWIQRSTCEWNYPSVVDKLFSAYNTIEWGSVTAADKANKVTETPPVQDSIIDGRTIWENKEGQIVAGIELSHAQPITIPMQRNYIVSSTNLAIAYSGDADPLLYFFNEDNSISTDGIAPYKTESVSDKKIAYYNYRDVNLSIESSGIGYLAKAKYLLIASSGSDISVFELATVSLNPDITYYIGGQAFDKLSNVSTLPGLKILGWYTTLDYREGTELGDKPGKSAKVYGKLAWIKDTVALAKYGIDPDAETVSPTPEVTEAPTATETPTATEVPTPTEAPVTTETPAATETPVITESPDIAESPAATKAPEGSGSDPKEKVESENSSGLWITILVIVVPVCIIIIIFVIWIIRKKK